MEAGTGPYMLESYTPDQEIVFTKNPDYWGGWQPGQFDKVVVEIVGEAVTQQQMLEGGQVDLVTRMPIENYASFKTNPNYTYTAGADLLQLRRLLQHPAPAAWIIPKSARRFPMPSPTRTSSPWVPLGLGYPEPRPGPAGRLALV